MTEDENLVLTIAQNMEDQNRDHKHLDHSWVKTKKIPPPNLFGKPRQMNQADQYLRTEDEEPEHWCLDLTIDNTDEFDEYPSRRITHSQTVTINQTKLDLPSNEPWSGAPTTSNAVSPPHPTPPKRTLPPMTKPTETNTDNHTTKKQKKKKR